MKPRPRNRSPWWNCTVVLGATLLVPAGVAVAADVDVSKLPAAARATVDFERDIQPIFRQACWSCHGPERQESGYRLDVRKIALAGGDSYAPNVVVGKSAESRLIHFVARLVEGMHMPAKGEPLTAEQVGLLRAWIDQGANWPDSADAQVADQLDWWSLRPLAVTPVPGTVPGARNEIDAFVGARLAEQGGNLLPAAERRTLIRRLSYDLIGLPPDPAEVDAFIHDADPLAYEKLVDRLLASPRYGERWARHWLDAIHFAETHGHDQDRIRENAWPYRDYLITSLNADKPYGRFIEEQVAGDALYPDDPQATVALGFLAAGPWDESSLRDIREDTLDRQIGRYLDRDDMLATVMNNVTSMTVQCARCHDHKFDPISQEDYYALQAVFAGVERANRVVDFDPAVHHRRRVLMARRKALDSKDPRLIDPAIVGSLLSPEGQHEVAEWERSFDKDHASWTVLAPLSAASAEGSTLTVQPDGSILASGTRPDRETYTITIRLPVGTLTALRLEVLPDESLPKKGPGRQDNGNLHLNEIEIRKGDPSGDRIDIARAVADFDQEGWDIARSIDGNEQSAWGIFPSVGQPHEAVFEFKEKLSLTCEQTVTVILKQLHGGGHLIGRPRLAVTNAAPPVQPGGPPAEIAAVVATPAAQRTEDQRRALALYYHREKVAREIAALPQPSYIYAAASDFEPDAGLKPPPGPRPIHVLRRGDIRQPLGEVFPGALTCVPALPARFEIADAGNESLRRAALAHWLTEPENPLTWRTIVNRVWHHHFGRGLVETPNDFGRMGAAPTHPELLDWLATWFRDRDRSLKNLHRLIVTSATYRQKVTPNSQAGMFNPKSEITRLDAECVRDAVLAVSGRLDLRMGGPSDRQFDLKPGRHVTPIIDYGKFDLDGPSGRRRSIYRFLFRTLPDPFMESLDCPAGDQFTPVRTNTVTVQQALAMWNDAFIVRHCEHFAGRLERLATNTPARVRAAFRLALSRDPTDEELQQLSEYADRHGLANFCRLIFNSNEFVFVN